MLIWGCIALAVFLVALGWAMCKIAAPTEYPEGEDE